MGETGTDSGGAGGGGGPWRGSKAFGDYLGVSEGRVRQLVGRGMPVAKEGRRSVFTVESLRWYEANAGDAARRLGKGGERPGAGRPAKADGAEAAEETDAAGDEATVSARKADGSTVSATLGDAKLVLGEHYTPRDLWDLDLPDIERIDRSARAYKSDLEAKQLDGQLVSVEEASREWSEAVSAMGRSLHDAARTAVDRLINAGLLEPGRGAEARAILGEAIDEARRRLATETFGPPPERAEAGSEEEA